MAHYLQDSESLHKLKAVSNFLSQHTVAHVSSRVKSHIEPHKFTFEQYRGCMVGTVP